MALYQEFFRLKNLDDASQQKLSQALYKYLPTNLHAQALAELDKNGIVSDDTLSKAVAAGVFKPESLSGVRNAIQGVVKALPSAKVMAQETLDKMKGQSEADMTDDELKQKMEAYKIAGGYQPPPAGSVTERIGEAADPRVGDPARDAIDQEEFKKKNGRFPTFAELRDFQKQGVGITPISESPFSQAQTNGQIQRQLSEKGISAFSKYDLSGKIGGFLTKNGRLPTHEELRDLLELSPTDRQAFNDFAPLKNFLTDSKVMQALDIGNYTDDLRRIQGLLDTRAGAARKEGDVQQFLKTGPEELRNARNLFYRQQSDSAGNFLRTRLTPQIMEGLNARGLAENPGDIASSVSSAGNNLQAGIEDKIRALEAQDNAFFADAAFRITQAKLDASEDAMRSQITLENQKIRQRQEANFQQAERDTAGDFEKNLLTRTGNRDLNAATDTLDSTKNLEDTATLAKLGSDTGKSIGETTGTAIVTSSKPSGSPPAYQPERIG